MIQALLLLSTFIQSKKKARRQEKAAKSSGRKGAGGKEPEQKPKNWPPKWVSRKSSVTPQMEYVLFPLRVSVGILTLSPVDYSNAVLLLLASA